MTGAAQLLSGAEGGYIIGAISYSRSVRMSLLLYSVALPLAVLFCEASQRASFYHPVNS